MIDVLIIGSGLAGLVTAASLPESCTIAIVAKAPSEQSNSVMAQGGIAAVITPPDSLHDHIEDTVRAGVFHGDRSRIRTLVENGSHLVRQLAGIPGLFDRDKAGYLQLGLEGAHSHRRILHSGGDASGRGLVSYYSSLVKKRNIRWYTHHEAAQLIVRDNRCYGAVIRSGDSLEQLYATHTVLATGGAGSLFSFTSNSPGATGDGLSLAWHAGAALEDLEFFQFHPTLLVKNGSAAGLISEAVRGEGATLITEDGQPLVTHPLGDLAPRDIVSRALAEKQLAGEKTFLSLRNVKNFTTKFPTITALCDGMIDADQKLPVAPGAHFHMGGVQTNEFGETTVQALYAAGEVACTGVHGANRLASNSLLECIVFGTAVAKRISSSMLMTGPHPVFRGTLSKVRPMMLSRIQQLMTKATGITRTASDLQQALDELLDTSSSSGELIPAPGAHAHLSASLITHAALLRTESRGGHFRTDEPETKPEWEGKTITFSQTDISITHSRTEKERMIR